MYVKLQEHTGSYYNFVFQRPLAGNDQGCECTKVNKVFLVFLIVCGVLVVSYRRGQGVVSGGDQKGETVFVPVASPGSA